MRIVVADEMELEPFHDLSLLGVEVAYRPELDAGTLPAALDEAQVLVVRSTTVTAAAIERSRQLSLIVSAGVEVQVTRTTVVRTGAGYRLSHGPRE